MDQSGKVAADPARDQRMRENKYSPVSVRAREFGLARWVQPSRPASACSFSILKLNLLHTHTRFLPISVPGMYSFPSSHDAVRR